METTNTFVFFVSGMEGKLYYGYSKREWLRLFVCYLVFFFFGGIEASEGVYYSIMKKELEIPYSVQGFLVSMGSWSFIIGSPIVGFLMTLVNVKPIIVSGFIAYFVSYSIMFGVKSLWLVFIALFIEGLGGVFLDVGMNTLSTVIFTSHRGVMMNYLHFFYGLGSAVGPSYSNFIMKGLNMGYRGIFVGLIVPAIIGLVCTLCSRLSLKQDSTTKQLAISSESYGNVEKSNGVGKPVLEENSLSASSSQVVPTEQPSTIVNESSQPSQVTVEVPDQSDQSFNQSINESLALWKCFLSPVVWLLGLNMGAVYAIESITVNWSGLYLQEVFDVTSDDMSFFLSLYYVFYTIARLVTGFIVDYVGDTKSVILFNCVLILFYILCFAIGRPAMWFLSFSGFLMSPFYPTAITVPMEVLGKQADKAISVILCIALIVNWVIQVVIGYVNEYIGSQWGYRILSISMCVMMIVCMLAIQCYLKKRKNNSV